MKKTISLIFLFLLLVNSVFAISVNENVTFSNNYDYSVDTNFNVNTIRVEGSELYFDGIAYCEWSGINNLDTLRECITTRICNDAQAGTSTFSNFFVIIVLAIMSIVLIGAIGFGVVKEVISIEMLPAIVGGFIVFIFVVGFGLMILAQIC